MKKSKKTRRSFGQNVIAVVYDFDGTLTPLPMQEYTMLPELQLSSKKFWEEVKKETKKTKADGMLTYMRLLIEKIEEKRTHLDKNKLQSLAKNINYYPGVKTWFDRINDYVKEKSNDKVKIKHYIISSGLKEILEGIDIKKNFERMYASEYFFDHHHVAKFPTIVINDTSKTQFLFRINKGIEDVTKSINEYMPESERAIPFSNMIYIGDGLTDVPSMTVVKMNSGFAIAVYKPNSPKSLNVCKKLVKAKRINYFAPANYGPSKKLEKRMFLILDIIISKILFEKERFLFRSEVEN
ncbi:MAG: HAD family hydrolase [Candidatus Scalinduaceae bacterium]